MAIDFQAEAAATEAISKWLRDGWRCVELCHAAKMPLHPALIRVLGEEATTRHPDLHSSNIPGLTVVLTHPNEDIERRRQPTKRRDPSTLTIPPEPPPPSRPALAEAHWVYLRAKDASPRILTIAVIFQENRAGRYIYAAEANRMVNKARESRRDSAAAYNSLQRLRSDGDLDESDGITIKNPELKGVIKDGWIWVPERLLGDQDRAAIRRRAITLILLENGPLSTADVTKVLARCTWLPTTITKDASKADLTAMELDGRVRRLGDKTWEATTEN